MQASTNYIYILFAVAYAVYSIIKASKKITANRPTSSGNPTSETGQSKDELRPVRPPTATSVPQYSPGEELKKMLEDLMGGTKEKKVPEVQAPKSKQQIPSGKPKYGQTRSHHHSTEYPKITSQSLEKEKPKSVPEEHLPDKSAKVSKKVFTVPVVEEKLESDFDIQQAIIYSEILKRPEY